MGDNQDIVGTTQLVLVLVNKHNHRNYPAGELVTVDVAMSIKAPNGDMCYIYRPFKPKQTLSGRHGIRYYTPRDRNRQLAIRQFMRAHKEK